MRSKMAYPEYVLPRQMRCPAMATVATGKVFGTRLLFILVPALEPHSASTDAKVLSPRSQTTSA